MHRFALLLFVVIVGCKDDSGDDSGGDTAGDSGTAGASSSADGAEMGDACDVVNDCESCWMCAKESVCSEQYTACAASFECAGSLACIGYKCPPEDITQSCVDDCCFNCAEHLLCNVVDTAVACIEAECTDYCGGSTAVCG